MVAKHGLYSRNRNELVYVDAEHAGAWISFESAEMYLGENCGAWETENDDPATESSSLFVEGGLLVWE